MASDDVERVVLRGQVRAHSRLFGILRCRHLLEAVAARRRLADSRVCSNKGFAVVVDRWGDLRQHVQSWRWLTTMLVIKLLLMMLLLLKLLLLNSLLLKMLFKLLLLLRGIVGRLCEE